MFKVKVWINYFDLFYYYIYVLGMINKEFFVKLIEYMFIDISFEGEVIRNYLLYLKLLKGCVFVFDIVIYLIEIDDR